ncbi:MAG: type III-B CRISPR module RAMP protein Cmr4 [Candidatus Poribacteria bacterium]
MPRNSTPYRKKTYCALALDPIHVGASGERQMSIVDNTIVRDPATNLPKIPGTSLAGAARTYTAMHYPEKFQRPSKDSAGNLVMVSCAGRRDVADIEHCGEPDCPVCVCYGFTQGDDISFPSMTQFFDVQILFFPVRSMLGPVWVTSIATVKNLVEAGILNAQDINLRLEPDSTEIQTNLKSGKLNLGWLMLTIKERSDIINETGKTALRRFNIPAEIVNNLVLVSERLFGHIVDDNLEVRTSTAIDPLTGAAKSGALFSYEAIPRSTVMWFDVVYKEPSDFRIDNVPIDKDIPWVIENVEKGFAYMEHLGVGGMTTRGMGRFKILNLE